MWEGVEESKMKADHRESWTPKVWISVGNREYVKNLSSWLLDSVKKASILKFFFVSSKFRKLYVYMWIWNVSKKSVFCSLFSYWFLVYCIVQYGICNSGLFPCFAFLTVSLGLNVPSRCVSIIPPFVPLV